MITASLIVAALGQPLQRTLDFAVGRSFVSVPKDGRDYHRACQCEGKREGYENPFHRQS
jgi:hypothetical protein